ncbi:unnamed protein product [Acanthoscelides obtectus]|uniref:Uncharacterized protein n=1 Tax=Acanthoscelides obtectus TaxID=200917 RepID=A0A9P0PZ64_ACAOB|nr:unnamed protein product [Acanthoscelides obtectus]CAK1681712.1 hypothetical protein AOBTE_LOCUS33238 [Acanthoscelides obtectus]
MTKLGEYYFIFQIFSKLGGRDITNRTNIILRHLISNNLAVSYNYLGTRQEKKTFKPSFLNRVGLFFLAPMLPKKMCEEDAIKTWLKIAPKRYKTKYSYIFFILSSSRM